MSLRVNVVDALKKGKRKKTTFLHELIVLEETEGKYEIKDSETFKENNEGETRTLEEFIKENKLNEDSYKIFFDQSTNTGYSLFKGETLVAMGKVVIGRGGGVPKYKNELSKILNTYMEFLHLEEVWYEEVYDSANMRTTEILMYIKHIFKDLRYENRQKGLDTYVYGVDHATWKKILSDRGIKNNRGDVKAQVREYVFKELPLEDLDSRISEDMSDAIGMGIARNIKLTNKYSYMMARFESKLPIHEIVYIGNVTEDNINDLKIRKPFREARELGSLLYTVEEGDKLTVKPTELARRVLSHTDKLVVIEIPKDYKEFGVIMLLNNISSKEFTDENNKVYMMYARKKRL